MSLLRALAASWNGTNDEQDPAISSDDPAHHPVTRHFGGMKTATEHNPVRTTGQNFV